MSYSSEVLADNPYLYWRLDETGGATVAQDATANNRDGNYLNTPTQGVTPPFSLDGTAVTFAPASSEEVESVGSFTITGTFSVEFFAKRRTTGLGQDGIIEHGATGAADQLLHITFNASTTFRFAFWADDLDITITDDANWHHWVCVYNATTNRQEVWRDKISIGSRTATADLSTASSTFHAGSSFISGQGFFDGSLDEVALYMSELTSTRIAAHYDAAQVSGLIKAGSGIIGP